MKNPDSEIIKAREQIPAKTQNADFHYNCNKYGIDDTDTSNICKCCGQIEKKSQFQYCISVTSKQLGTGVVMFFQFIKVVISYLVIRLIITDGYNMYTNLIGSNCGENKKCPSQMFTKLSTANKLSDKNQLLMLDILNLATIAGSIIYFFIMRYLKYTEVYELEQQNTTQDDFSLYVTNLPIIISQETNIELRQKEQQMDYQSFIVDIFSQIIDDWVERIQKQGHTQLNQFYDDYLEAQKQSSVIIKQINLCWNLNEIVVMENLKENYKQIKQKQLKGNQDNELIQQMTQYITLTNQQIQVLYKKFAETRTKSFCLSHFIGKAFVTFQFQVYKYILLQQLKYQTKQNPDNYNYQQGGIITAQQAQQPREIFWYNLFIKDRFTKQVYSWAITVAAIIFSFAIIAVVNYFHDLSVNDNHTFFEKAISYLILYCVSFLILLINFLLTELIRQLVKFQQYQTQSQHIFHYVFKILFAQFFNTCMTYYIMTYITKSEIYDQNGIIMEVTGLITSISVLQVVFNAIRTQSLIRWFKLKIKYSRIRPNYTYQEHYNADYQLPVFDFANRYSYYILQVYLVSFFSYIIPVGIPIMILVFIIQFHIDKANLFYRSSLRTEFGFNLTTAMIKFFEISIVFFSVGNMIFSLFFSDTISIYNWCGFGLSVLYLLVVLLIPSKFFLKKILRQHAKVNRTSIDNYINSGKLQYTYRKCNPATKVAELAKELHAKKKK